VNFLFAMVFLSLSSSPLSSLFSLKFKFIMTVPHTIETATFHGSTAALPAEITLLIMRHVSADTLLLPMGGGVGMRRAHHPIASVSRPLRQLYLSQPYPARAEERAAAPVRCNIGGALHFDDLQTLASFFREGPGCSATTLRRILCIVISYLDDQAVGWWAGTKLFAYEAFELLHKHWHLMSVTWLRLQLPYTHAVVSVDDPGIWSLLKIRNVARFDIVGRYSCIAPDVRRYLKARTSSKKLFPWRPLGIENPGPRKWQDRVKHRNGVPEWQTQYEWLDTRYKYLHDRRTVAARREKRQIEDRKRKQRFPLISKRRKGKASPVAK
jgi:hypothetical protein